MPKKKPVLINKNKAEDCTPELSLKKRRAKDYRGYRSHSVSRHSRSGAVDDSGLDLSKSRRPSTHLVDETLSQVRALLLNLVLEA